MINVKLIDIRDGKVICLAESKIPGNECFLCQEDDETFPILSEITEVDIERFFYNEMDGLITELESVGKTLNSKEQKDHLTEIVRLCEKCKGLPNSQIVFDPFTEKMKLENGKWIDA